MKKIAFIITGIYHISGVSSATSIIANELAKKGDYEISIITLTDRSNTQFVDLNENIKIIKIFDKPVNLKLNVLKILRKLRGIISKNEFDVVISSVLFFPMLYLSYKRCNNIKLIAWEHATIEPQIKRLSIKYLIRKLAAEKSDALVVITKEAKNVYLQRYKKARKIVQIYNSIEKLNTASYNYNSNSKKIISAGALLDIKGFDIAIKVAKLALENHPDWQWHIYGEGKEKNILEELIVGYGLQNQVKLMGYSNKLSDLYKEYSFYVLTSRSESFGMVILEAQKNNLPVISFDCPYGPRELIVDGINGFLIAPFNEINMVNKIKEMISNQEVREKMSSNARQLSGGMNKEAVVERWESLLSKL